MKLIEKTLAPLASLKVQERYIVHGDKDNYLLPQDLLERAINFLFEQQGVKYESTDLMKKLKENIKRIEIPQSLSNHDLIYKYKPWIVIRENSRLILKKTGFNLEEWEENEL